MPDLPVWEQIADKPWLAEVLAIEERERQKRGLERRVSNARVGVFKPMVDFNWNWPKKVDREAIDELFSLGFMKTGHNGVLVGPNGVGKTMILKNVAHQALVRGHTVRFATASDMLADLAAQDSSSAVARRLRRYTVPQLLCVDEVGYLSYDSRYADLLFEVVTRRYESQKPLLLSTNKAFAAWSEVSPTPLASSPSSIASSTAPRSSTSKLRVTASRKPRNRTQRVPNVAARNRLPDLTTRSSPVNFTEYPRVLMPVNTVKVLITAATQRYWSLLLAWQRLSLTS